MTGIAAVAMCAAFTSCSHDIVSASPEDIEMQRAEKIQNTYNKAFIATFGQPAANQDWGFSSALTRSIVPENNNYTLTNQPASNPEAPSQPVFRGKPTIPTFSATVPQGTPEATSNTNLEAGKTYQIKTGSLNNPQNQQNMTFYVVDDITWNGQVNKDGNGTTFIITEGKTLTYNQSEALNLKIYMAPNSHLVIGNNVIFKKDGAMLYIGSGCTVTCGANVLFAEKYTVLNEGTSFTAQQLNIEEGTLFYNNAPLTATTGIHIQKTQGNNDDYRFAELVNTSTVTTPAITIEAGGGMYNVSGGEVTVEGKTYLYNTNSCWWNDGVYTSQDFELNSIDHVWNTCKLTVHKSDNTGTFKIASNAHTSFVLDANSSVQTDKVWFGNNADFYMNNNSMLEVLGEFKSYNFNKNHGIHGVGTSYSIFKAGSVTYNEKGQNRMNYYGKVWIDTDNHFQQELLDKNNLNEASDQPTYYFKTGTDRTVKFKFFGDACPITARIDPSTNPCHHGYTPPTPPTDFTANLRVMAEDLSASEQTDFDFNDIVFDIQYGSPAQIRVMAAGGTLPLRIKVKSTASHDDVDCTGKDGNGWQEIHALWGKGTGIMINTNATTIISPNKGYETSTLLDPIELDYAVNNPADAKDIIIEVKKTIDGKTGWYPMNAETGEPAAKFACSPNLRWANEREDLKGNSNFSSWVQGAIRTWNWNNFQ